MMTQIILPSDGDDHEPPYDLAFREHFLLPVAARARTRSWQPILFWLGGFVFPVGEAWATLRCAVHTLL